MTPAQKLFQGQKSPKKRKKIQTLEQWVEIEVSETGKTVTTQYPSNEILIQDGQKKWPAPELVYRRMHFVHGVPHEYAWATSDERTRKSGGMGIQRMTVDTWLELIEKEKALGTGHLLPWREFAEAGRAGRVRLSDLFEKQGNFGGAGGVEGGARIALRYLCCQFGGYACRNRNRYVCSAQILLNSLWCCQK